jgi:HAD superfamily hydrolase (TIGR01509 family)
VIKGLIFDFDGLILDTETPDYIAWQKVYKSYNLDFSFNDWAAGVGAPLETIDLASLLERKLSYPLNKISIRNEQHVLSLGIIQNQDLMPGVKALINCARESGMKLAIASSSDATWVKTHLSRLDLENKFDQICTIDQVSKGKPDPALYLLALESLDLKPSEVIALEDSPNGIKSAKAANLFCIAVINTMTSQMDLSQADIILSTLEGINLEEIIFRVNSII